MKLIKTNILFIILITLVSLQSNASDPDGIKLNNEAVELLEDAIKAKSQSSRGLKKGKAKVPTNTSNGLPKLGKSEDKNQKSIMSKLLGLFVGDSKDTIKSSNPKNKEEEKEKTKESTDVDSGEFLAARNKEEKEDKGNDIDEDIVFEAHKKILQATRKSGELAEIRMNLGLSFELSEDIENSLKAYNMAERAAKSSPGLEFMARYNKARVLAAQKKIPLALAQYQSALELNPESIEVKVNIELLTQKQQGGGGGEGDKEKKDGDQGKGKPKPDAPIKKNPKNSEYKSQKLSKKDVEKILEELKNQEQNIREKEYNKGVKEKSRDKDW